MSCVYIMRRCTLKMPPGLSESDRWSLLMFHLHSTHHGFQSAAQAGTGSQRTNRDTMVRQAELIISWVLRGGVFLSAGVIALGLALFIAGRARAQSFPHTLPAVARDVLHGEPLGVVMLGLLLLLCTPVLRLVVSVIAFALEGDRRYVSITALVLALLL